MNKELVKHVKFEQKENSLQECGNILKGKHDNRVSKVRFLRRKSYFKLKCAI